MSRSRPPALRCAPLLIALVVLSAPPAAAQSPLPDWLEPQPYPPAEPPALGPGPPAPPTTPEPVPVDGGLGLLALAGAGYAARRLRRRATNAR